jgi:hypothetical protein
MKNEMVMASSFDLTFDWRCIDVDSTVVIDLIG